MTIHAREARPRVPTGQQIQFDHVRAARSYPRSGSTPASPQPRHEQGFYCWGRVAAFSRRATAGRARGAGSAACRSRAARGRCSRGERRVDGEDESGGLAGRRALVAGRGHSETRVAGRRTARLFEKTFTARAGVPYRLWIRSRAQNDAWTNDSVFVQFSAAVDANGIQCSASARPQPRRSAWKIATGAASPAGAGPTTAMALACYGPLIYFAADGQQTVRVQGREDGMSSSVKSCSRRRNTSRARPGANEAGRHVLPPSDGSLRRRRRSHSSAVPICSSHPTIRWLVVWATREAGPPRCAYDSPGGEAHCGPAASRLVREG